MTIDEREDVYKNIVNLNDTFSVDVMMLDLAKSTIHSEPKSIFWHENSKIDKS